MPCLPLPRRALLVVAALAALLPVRAEAQLGGLRKKIEKQMQKAVLGPDEAKPNAAPTFTDRVLEITDARLNQLVAGLKAEAALAERESRAQAATDAQYKAWEARSEAYGRCAEPFKDEMLKGTGMMMGLALAAKREEQKQGSVSPALRDSIAAVTARMQKAGEAMKAKCGDEPGPSPFEATSADGADGAADAESVGAKAAGLTRDQYAVLRERVAAFVHARGRGTAGYVFASGERDVLGRRGGELAAYGKLLGG
jgi:hypothetical protein